MLKRTLLVGLGTVVGIFGLSTPASAQDSLEFLSLVYNQETETVYVVYEDDSDDNQTEPATVQEIYLGLEYKRRGRGKFRPLESGLSEAYPPFTLMGDNDGNGFDEYMGHFYYDTCGTAEQELGDLSDLSFRLVATLELENGREFRYRTDHDCSD